MADSDLVANSGPGTGAASGVASTPGAANVGVSGEQPQGTEAEQARSPKVIPEEDFKRLQRTLNQQNDSLRLQIQQRDGVLNQLQHSMDENHRQLQQLLAAKDEEILSLRTAGLSESEAEAERAKHQVAALRREKEALERRYNQDLQAAAFQRDALQERQSRDQTINLFLEGGTTPGGRRLEAHNKFGLTAADLEACRSPEEMQAVATEKREDYFANREVELKRRETALDAETRKRSGAQTFDRGEPTSGGPTMPKPGTAEFRDYVRQVADGKIRLNQS